MCIKKSVGRGGENDSDDVKTIQVLLNLNLDALPNTERLAVDGAIGKNTMGLIDTFQANIVGMAKPDGRVDPGGGTLRALQRGMPAGLNQDKLQGIMVHSSSGKIEKFADSFMVALPKYEINTPLRQAHFLAQIAHESGSLRYTEELASGEAYEGRADLGNTEPGDGVKFKGRGLIQLTGRANYTEYGNDIGQDLTTDENYTKVAEDPDLAVDVSCWFWKKRKLNDAADQDDVRKITKRINGGYNGLDDRMAYLERSRFFLIPPD